jgi:hypothetical protein
VQRKIENVIAKGIKPERQSIKLFFLYLKKICIFFTTTLLQAYMAKQKIFPYSADGKKNAPMI